MSFVARLSLLSIALVAGLVTHASAAVIHGSANGSIVSFQLSATGATTYSMTNFNLGTYSINGVTGDFPVDPFDPAYTVEDYNVRNYRASMPIGTINFNTASAASVAGDVLRFQFNDGLNPVITYDFFSSQITYVSGILSGSARCT